MQNFTRKFFNRRTAIYLTFAILLCGQHLVLAAQSYKTLQQKISLKTGRTNVGAVIRALQQQTSFIYAYDPLYLEKCAVSELEFSSTDLGKVLEFLDRNTPVDIDYNNNTIAIRAGKAEALARRIEEGTIAGKVVDNRNEPLPGVTIMVEGKGGTVTQVDGSYTIKLPPGKYVLTFRYISYNTQKVTDIIVKEKQLTPLNVLMTSSSSALKEVVITGNYQKASVEGLYALQKNNAAVSDGISAEQIRVTPDNNAAQVLKRVNGITVQDDKFVTVRGLSERYNNVILNGANLPSTEPNRRNFSFDVIPSALIDNIIVNKTATPDMPAEFAGGLVQVNTRSIPEKNFLSITLGTGINTNSTGKSMYGTKRGGNDYLGFDDGTRGWWNKKWSNEEYRGYIREGNSEKRSEMERAIPNNWGLREYPYSPVQNYQLMFGRKIDLKDKISSFGVTLAATYRHEESVVDETRYFPSYYLYDSARTYNFNTSLGAVANIGFQTKGHKIAFKNLYNRRFSNESSVYQGTNWDRGDGLVKYYIDLTLINSLWQNRLEGEHLLGKHLKFDWSADNIALEREQPDTRASNGRRSTGPKGQFRSYNLNDGTGGVLSDGLAIFNANLKEKRKNVAANFTIPFKIGGVAQNLKAGYAGTFREADNKSLVLRMYYDPAAVTAGGPERIDSAVFGRADYELHTPEFLRPGLLQYQPSGIGTQGFAGDDYIGKQQVHATYLMTDLKFLKHFRFIGGVRMEQSIMDLRGISYILGIETDTLMKYNKTDWLPSFNLVYSLNDKMNVRAAYSQTLARADFRERAPYIYYEFKERSSYKGAVGLKDANITNMDLRYEYYPAPGEVISVSAFYKKFKNPVELIGDFSSGSAKGIFYYFNLESSASKGFELDLRKSLGFIRPGSKLLKQIYVSANASWMEANVKYNTTALLDAANGIAGRNDTVLAPNSRNRSLQGLSPYVVNGSIGYFGDVIGLNVAYNRFGSRILAGGYQPWEDQYENARDVIDVQLSAILLKKRMQVRLNISDLLQQEYIIYQNQSLKPSGSSGGGSESDPYMLTGKPNNDPKGNRYNREVDYVRHRWFKGRNLSLNITYNF